MDVDEAEVESEVTPAPDAQAQLALAAHFAPFPFTHSTRNAILMRRALMANELVLDLLLEQASIASPQSLYPPDSQESLLQLLEAIANCPWDTLKKSCLHFYLLCHLSADVATQHATTCALPPQFVHLAHACFLLDSGSSDDLARAVALLSDARIVQDLSSKILHTLSLAPQPLSSRLVRTYVRTAQPVLESYEDLAIYLRALMDYNLAEAWTFQRTFSETTPTRNQLIRTILDGCLIPPKPTVLPHLLSLPLTSFEFSLLQSYSLSPPEELSPAAHAILQDLITVRLLHSGKYSDAVRLSRAFDTLNAKSGAAPLHKAAQERQQMMRDVLAVVPEVQRRQLDDEQHEGEGEGESAWASMSVSMSNDVSMSWENLGASGSGSVKARDKAVGGIRSGRLEGSPVPSLPGRPNAPFGPFTTANSAQKRKSSANANSNLNIFGTPSSAAKPNPPRTPVFPPIPTPGLVNSTSTGTPPAIPGFPRAQRFNFATPSSRQPQQPQDNTGPVSAPRPGAGLNARNAFYEPEPSRASSSLFGGQPQGQANNAQQTRAVNGEERKVGAGGDAPTIDGPEGISEDVTMVESDDPDAFVMRSRRRLPVLSPPPQHADADADDDTGAMDAGSSLFRRDKDSRWNSDQTRSKSETRVLPGGFKSVELMDDPRLMNEPQPQPPRKEARPSTRSRQSAKDAQPQRLKIPGGLFDDEEAEAEHEEEQDHVPSLPPVPAPAKGGRRKRISRASSVAAESGSEDDQSKTHLRRSSRLSSTGPSPEPPSPQKPERKTASKRGIRSMDGAAPVRSTRKRKNAEE